MTLKIFNAGLLMLAAAFAAGCGVDASESDDLDADDETVGIEESALTYPAMDVPFKCGVQVIGSTWADHNPLKAIDFRLPYGSRVDASAAGTVTYVNLGTASYGKYIVINHGNGWSTRYAHLSQATVTSGHVDRGQPIGVSGDSGKAAGAPHLHYEQIYNGSVVAIKLAGS
ncbi:MAG: M23 family metallopeptidase, partial [Byssovorax sp.]